MNATAKKASILVERTYPASVSELWDLWATPHFTEMQKAGFTSQLRKLDKRYTT